jgi:hypothetical protein
VSTYTTHAANGFSQDFAKDSMRLQCDTIAQEVVDIVLAVADSEALKMGIPQFKCLIKEYNENVEKKCGLRLTFTESLFRVDRACFPQVFLKSSIEY